MLYTRDYNSDTNTMISNRLRSTSISLFHFLFLVTPFVFTWVNEELFEFNKMLFVYGMTVLLMGLWGIRMFLEKRIILRKTPLDIALALFLISQIISTVFSIHPPTSLFGYYTRFNGGLLSTFAYIGLFYTFVNTIEKKHIQSLFLSLLLGGLFISLYAIPEHFGHSPSCYLITGKFTVSCWVQDVQNRVFATFGQPNWLAAYTITLLPVALAFSQLKKTKKIQLFLYVVLAALFITTLFTKSRSGQLGLGIGLGAFAVGSMLIWKKLSQVFKKFTGSFALIIVIALLVGTALTPSISDFLTKKASPSNTENISQEETPSSQVPLGGTDSGEIRKIVWKGAIDVWKRYPIFGSGVETFAYSYYQDRPMAHNLVSEWDFLYNKAHNEFLNYLATTGVVGLSTYLFFLGSYIFLSLRYILSRKNTDDTKLQVLGLASGIIALSVSNFFGFSTVMTSLFLFIFPAFFVVLTVENPQEKAKDSEPSFLSYSGSIAAVIAMFFLLASVYRMWKADETYAKGQALLQANEYIAGATKIQEAIAYTPNQALFYDELANSYSRLAIAYAQANDATTSAQLADAAIKTSDFTLQLNNRHVNFYKTRARIFINLSQLDPSLLTEAEATLNQALELAPTDAKLMYNLGLVQISHDEIAKGEQTLLTALEMKPNYLNARLTLAKEYQKNNQIEEARKHYQYLLDFVVPGNKEIEASLRELDQ